MLFIYLFNPLCYNFEMSYLFILLVVKYLGLHFTHHRCYTNKM